MTSATVLQINFIIQQMNIFVGIIILVTGVIGGLLNITIFTTLKTFRQTSCGFYLTVTSLFNVGQAVFALTTRVLASGFFINLTNEPWSCKLRTFLAQSCVLLSLTSMSLATIDQFLPMTAYRYLSSVRMARRHTLIGCCVWSVHGIFAFIYWDTPEGVCTTISATYAKYLSCFYLPVFLGCLPIFVMVTFSVLAFVRARTLASRQINIVRLSHERQLTAMTLLQVAFIVFTSVIYTVFNIYDLNTVLTNEDDAARHRLIGTVAVLLYYESFASPFYIFCCASKRFRQQLVYVLFKVHLYWLRGRSNKVDHNQAIPEGTVIVDEPVVRGNITIHDITLQTLNGGEKK